MYSEPGTIPPSRLSRAEQQARTRERLLASAESVFSRLGYDGSSVDLIAEEAGFSKGAVYSNFENKEALFLELLRRHMERDMEGLAETVQVAPDQLPELLGAWLHSVYVQSDCPLLVTELQLHARRSPAFAQQYYALQQRQNSALADVLGQYCSVTGCRSEIGLTDLAAALMALAHGLGLQKPAAGADAPNEVGRIIGQLLKALTLPQD